MIQEREWRGVMVEPVPYVFERLRAAYAGNDRVTLENAAIADRNGRLPFYHLAEAADYEPEGMPEWYDGIGSLSCDAVLSHARAIPDIEARLSSPRWLLSPSMPFARSTGWHPSTLW